MNEALNKNIYLVKELFTSADNDVLQISESVPADSMVRQLILAAVMCIDMVLKEQEPCG